MTKLEELEAAWEALNDRAIAAYKAVATAEYAADAAEYAADEAWAAADDCWEAADAAYFNYMIELEKQE